MNPTDQARKEARKRELKKNKKQRHLVRTAVLKNKDPGQIISELDQLDEVEYNPTKPPALAEKVLKDKRKKLRETLERVMKLYVILTQSTICTTRFCIVFRTCYDFIMDLLLLMYILKINSKRKIPHIGVN